MNPWFPYMVGVIGGCGPCMGLRQVQYSSMTELHVKANNTKSFDFTSSATMEKPLVRPVDRCVPN